MAAPTPKTKEYDESEKDRRFHDAIKKLARTVPFISLNANGKKQIAFLARFSESTKVCPIVKKCFDERRIAPNGIRNEWNCRECWRRVDRLFPFMDAVGDGPLIYQFSMSENLTAEQSEMVLKKTEFLKKLKGYQGGDYWELEVVGSVKAWQNTMAYVETYPKDLTKQQVHELRKTIGSKINLQTEAKGGFSHYYMNPTEVSSEDVDLLLMNKAFQRYKPLLFSMFDKFTRQEEWDGMIASLEIMLEILEEATYGGKFVASTRWLLNCFKSSVRPLSRLSVVDQVQFIGHAICTAPITTELGNQAAMPFYHQVNNNILNLLGSAQSKESMRKMVEERLNPDYYQQKTAAPKAGAVAMAAKALGQFDVTVTTTYELENNPRFSAAIKVGRDTEEPASKTTDIYAGIRTKGKDKAKVVGAAGFAGRVGPKTNKFPDFVTIGYDGKHTMSIHELLKRLKSGEIYKMRLYYDRELKQDALITSNTLDPEKLIHSHTWLFLNSQGQHFPYYSTADVTHVVPIVTKTHTNCIFVLKGAREAVKMKPLSSTTNACLGEFLNSKYHACKSTFMEVGRTLGLKIPPPQGNDDLAMGVGISKKDVQSSVISNELKIYINAMSEPIYINKWI